MKGCARLTGWLGSRYHLGYKRREATTGTSSHGTVTREAKRTLRASRPSAEAKTTREPGAMSVTGGTR